MADPLKPPSDLQPAQSSSGPPADLMKPPADLQPAPGRSSAPKMDLTPKKEERDWWDRTKDVITEGGFGAAIGAAAPEILMYGAAPAAAVFGFPEASPFIYGAGQSMRGARLAEAGVGLLSGAGGEIAAQGSEMAGQGKTAQEAWRLAGGIVTPSFANAVKYTAGKLVGMTGLTTKAEVNQIASALAKDAGLNEESLSAQQKSYLRYLAEKIRGGAKSDEFAKQTYSRLEQNAVQIVDNYNAQARQLEAQATAAVEAAEKSKTSRVAGAQREALALQAQFESASKNLKDLARQRAANILKNAEAEAAKSRAGISNQSPSVRQVHEIDVQDMLQKARTEAQNIVNDAERRAGRLRELSSKTAKSGESTLLKGQQTVSAIGQAQTPTQTGTSIRDTVMPIFDKLKSVRSDNAVKNKGDAFSFALTKEKAGQKVSDTKAFKAAQTQIDNAIQNPETGLTNAPVDAVKNQLLTVKRSLDPKKEVDGVIVGTPVSFEGLETLRRFLRDRSYGLPAEGYDAISQQQAGKLADAVEAIQKEFSPSIGKFLEQYKKDSEPLRVFKTKLGEAVVGKEVFDMGRFSFDPAGLGSKFFKTETGVKDLITLLGGDSRKAESIARGYAGDQLRNADSKLIQRKIVEWRDWLPQFPGLQAELKAAEQRLAQAERVSGKRTKLSESLQREARELPGQASDAASRLEGDVLKAAQDKIVGAAETQGKADVAAAKKEAERLRGEAGKLSAQGEKIRRDILGNSFDVRRVEEIILRGDKNLWKEIGPILSANPQAKEATAKAISQVIANRVPRSPRAMVDIYAKDIRPAIEAAGLMDAKKLASLDEQMDFVRRTVDPTAREQMYLKVLNVLKYGLITEASRPPAAITNAILAD